MTIEGILQSVLLQTELEKMLFYTIFSSTDLLPSNNEWYKHMGSVYSVIGCFKAILSSL